MVDVNKVYRMTKLTLYESERGKKDQKMYQSSEKTYLALRQIGSLLAITAAYLIGAAFYCFYYYDDILSEGLDFSFQGLLLRLIVGYLAVAVVNAWVCGKIYRRRYEDMMEHIRKYDRDLSRLKRYIEKSGE